MAVLGEESQVGVNPDSRLAAKPPTSCRRLVFVGMERPLRVAASPWCGLQGLRRRRFILRRACGSRGLIREARSERPLPHASTGRKARSGFERCLRRLLRGSAKEFDAPA